LSLEEANRVTDSEAHVTQANEITNSKVSSETPNVDNTNELKTMLASILATMEFSNKESKENHKIFHDKVETSIRTLQDNLENNNRKLRESNDKSQRDIEIKLKRLQDNMKRDLKTETEK
jgi:hypothetical protein